MRGVTNLQISQEQKVRNNKSSIMVSIELKKNSRGLRLWGMGVVLVLKIRNEISGLLLWVEVKMVKNKIYFFLILFCPLVKILACCQVSTKKKWRRRSFFSPSAAVVLKEVILGLSINKCFVLKSTKNLQKIKHSDSLCSAENAF